MGHTHPYDSAKNLKAAFFLNLLFACIELAGGLYTNSVAILSDALHDIGDSLSLGVAWYFDKIAKKKRNKTYSFGYKRFTVIGALINTVVLTIGSIFIISEAIPRLLDPVMPDAQGMIILSIGGLAVNGFAAFRLSHGHSLNEKVAYLHLLEDVLGWAATLAVAITLHFHAIPILDPLLSIVISIFILYNVFKNIKASVTILLQKTPEGVEPLKVETMILSFPEVTEVHDCHIWTMDGQHNVLSIHVVIAQSLLPEEIIKLKGSIKQKLASFKIDHSTLEFEWENEDCNPC